MFWRLKRESIEPNTLDAVSGGFLRGGSETSASNEEDNAMPALADTLDSTRYAPSPFDDNDQQRKTGPGMKFAYSTGDQPLHGFTIKRGIGVGGFGEVYFAISEAGKEVAIKRVQRNLEIELRGVAHCMNLKHPNLIALYDTKYDDADQAWVIMEYVPGQTLREVLDDKPEGLSREQVLRWFGDLGAGVAHLHENGIVHRDLKPGNVFDDEGIVKIGDYGLSKFISCSRRGGHTESVGTFHYMAPEIGRGEYGKEIDIYALGIILFEILTGDVPFNGESSQEIIMKHLTSDPDLSKVEQPYRSVISKALQKNPDARQSSVVEMLAPLGIVIDKHGLARVGGVSKDEPIAAEILQEVEPILANQVVEEAVPNGQFAYNTRNALEQIQAAKANRTEKDAAGSSREPLAAAVSKSASDLSNWWNDRHLSPVGKAFVVVVACAILMLNSAWLIPMLSLLAILYVPYYIIRAMVLTARDQQSYATAHAEAVAEQQRRQMQPTQQQIRLIARRELGAKPLRTRGAELSESWMTSLVVLSVLGWVAGMFGLSEGETSARTIAPFAWGGMTALIGAWMMLGLGKLWEREDGEGLPRRIVQLGVGATVGAIAFASAKVLMIPLDEGFDLNKNGVSFPEHMYAGGEIQLPAMMAYFAAVFFLVRWWRNADPLRTRRLSVWSIASVVVVAWAVNQVIPVPQPWGMLCAGATALAIQMSASWKNPMESPTTNVA